MVTIPSNRPMPAPEPVVERAPTPAPEPAVAHVRAPEPEPEPEPELLAAPQPVGPPASGAELWEQIKERFRIKSPLKADYLDYAALQTYEGRTLRFGMPTTESAHREALLYAPVRKMLEEIISELLGRPMSLEIVLDSSLAPPPATEQTFSFADFDVPSAKPAAAPKEDAKPEAKPEATKVAVNEDFYNDPFIKEALEKFKATLVKS